MRRLRGANENWGVRNEGINDGFCAHGLCGLRSAPSREVEADLAVVDYGELSIVCIALKLFSTYS